MADTERKTIKLSAGSSTPERRAPNLAGGKSNSSPVKPSTSHIGELDDEDESIEEEILQDIAPKSKSKNNTLVVVVGVAVVALIVILFLLFGSKGKQGNNAISQDSDDLSVNVQPSSGIVNDVAQRTPAPQTNNNNSLGTQDFTKDTNMTTDAELTDPEQYIEDIYGLTTRVDYTVDSINYVADFVSYKKHRGTWGGGLELYWLESTYKGNKYSVQVPFKYYKELDEEGIVPVKMEVLTIKGNVEGEDLTVISYMCLDEATLLSILKAQSKK